VPCQPALDLRSCGFTIDLLPILPLTSSPLAPECISTPTPTTTRLPAIHITTAFPRSSALVWACHWRSCALYLGAVKGEELTSRQEGKAPGNEADCNEERTERQTTKSPVDALDRIVVIGCLTTMGFPTSGNFEASRNSGWRGRREHVVESCLWGPCRGTCHVIEFSHLNEH
jgi:hypothetical protein